MINTREEKSETPQEINRTGFRGDSRGPDVIFTDGFIPRFSVDDISYRTIGDLDATTAVAVSWRFRPTVYFPIEDPTQILWIYVVDIDLSQADQDKIFHSAIDVKRKKATDLLIDTPSSFFYTHGKQVLDAMDKKITRRSNHCMLFADECAVKEIKRENILFAVQCTRTFNNPRFPDNGGVYVLGRDLKTDPNGQDILPNPNRKNMSPERLEQIKQFLEYEINLSRTQEMKMPMESDGYHRSEPKIQQQIFNQLDQDISDQIEKMKKNSECKNGKLDILALMTLKDYLNDKLSLKDFNFFKNFNQSISAETEEMVDRVRTFKENVHGVSSSSSPTMGRC